MGVLGGGKSATTVINSYIDQIFSQIVPEMKKLYKSYLDPIITPTMTNIIEGLNGVSGMATFANGI